MDNVPWFKGAVKVHNFLVRNYMSKIGCKPCLHPYPPRWGGWLLFKQKTPCMAGRFGCAYFTGALAGSCNLITPVPKPTAFLLLPPANAMANKRQLLLPILYLLFLTWQVPLTNAQ